MELLYRVDEADNVLGSIEREEAHKNDVLHRSVVIFLLRGDGDVLVQWRSAEKKNFPSCYECSASGHVTFGETYEQAAKRELQEETGVSARVEYLGKYTHDHPPEHEMIAVFCARSDAAIKLDRSETESAKFYAPGKLDEIISSGRAAPWFEGAWGIARDRLQRK
jgi:isopentenyl-diphosphate delta-isomerase type 1